MLVTRTIMAVMQLYLWPYAVLGLALPGVRLVTWTILALSSIELCFEPCEITRARKSGANPHLVHRESLGEVRAVQLRLAPHRARGEVHLAHRGVAAQADPTWKANFVKTRIPHYSYRFQGVETRRRGGFKGGVRN
jgi:hypothetical protein